MKLALCDRYSSLNPLRLRYYKFHELIKTYQMINEHDRKQKSASKKTVIRRPAGDNWV
nr:MAG TPA: hypothetical protein [Caudoviricetes sp.]